MIEAIKARLWSVLEDKEVSLAMVYDCSGRILWSRGRRVRGRTVEEASGFPKSLIQQSIDRHEELSQQDVVLASSGETLPESARVLYLKSLLIVPVDDTFFLYVDSGSKSAFSPADCELFRTMGALLGETISTLKNSSTEVGGLVGSSPEMTEIRQRVIRYALEEEPVLLTGETGVGKNHVAELIHRASGRKGKLVVAHTPSIPENLVESELFGHRRGAYTGASEAHGGLVGEAEGGTLLLDEISEVPLSFQAKLLAFVETREYRRLGEAQQRRADTRLVAASNRDLAEEVREKRFRSDLFYRLNVLPIEIPPLRQRPDDIRDLVGQYLHLLRGKKPTEAMYQVLEAHEWPGNVRELLQVLRRAGIQLAGPTLGSDIETVLFTTMSQREQAEEELAQIEQAIKEGQSFWDTAWQRFLDRDLNRAQLASLLQRWYNRNGRSLRQLATALNLSSKEYGRFVSALHKYEIHPGKH